MPSATIKIFLAHGDPKRLRTAEISNWTGKAIAGPRSEFDDVRARNEAEKPGIYLLTGIDPETGEKTLYIGEAECLRDRLKDHLDKDFWNHITYFTSKDENLTKAHIRYLEGRLIDQAQKAARAIVKNSKGSGAKLPESDREDMEIFLEKIYQLLPALGIELLVSISSKGAAESEHNMLQCEIKGLAAKGHLTPNGFIVLGGSQAVLKERASAEKNPWVISSRAKLKQDGTLSQSGDHLIFTKDTEFPTPSAAAAVVQGGTANGLTEWRTKAGKTLKELESK